MYSNILACILYCICEQIWLNEFTNVSTRAQMNIFEYLFLVFKRIFRIFFSLEEVVNDNANKLNDDFYCCYNDHELS